MLHETIENKKETYKDDGEIERYAIPEYITDNLKFPLYEWQKDAIENFLINEYTRKKKGILTPNHLMFNMATGSGKTLVMAALILYYYKQGFRNFIFFVNQNNILGKTQDNFINKNHQKYLFKDNIRIDGKNVNIREVETFSDGQSDIQIIFTTIHKLHNAIVAESENALLLTDLQKRDIVLFGDEAHHLNASTLKKDLELVGNDGTTIELGELKDGAKDELVERTWERTVCHSILNKDGSTKQPNRNALLEFTATIPKDKAVLKKYSDKIIAKFEIKKFIQAGYTKHIKLVRSNLAVKERILQALLINWYRYQLALELELPNFKPVILFRNNTIEASKNDYEMFLSLVETLNIDDFSYLESMQLVHKSSTDFKEQVNKEDGTLFKEIISYMKEQGFDKSVSNLVEYIKTHFGERNCIITNSKSNSAKTEKTDAGIDYLLNSLESPSNHIQAIFTVQRLTEGWDVLNLFDIVRLNRGRDTNYKKAKVGKSTTSEVQLIGRGIRYCPFKYKDKDSRRRKFDDDISNKYRVLEEFYFHSDSDEKYINELLQELKNTELIESNRVLKRKKFSIKPEILKDFENEWLIGNDRVENPDRKLKKVPDDFNKLAFTYDINQKYSEVRKVNFEDLSDDVINSPQQVFNTTKGEVPFSKLEELGYFRHIFYKAIHRLSVANDYFSIANLRERFNVNSLDEFYTFLGSIKVDLRHNFPNLKDIPHSDLLEFTEKFLLFCKDELEKYDKPYIGTAFTNKSFNEIFKDAKYKMIDNVQDSNNIEMEKKLQNENWYMLDSFNGTSLELELIDFITVNIKNLQEKYSSVFLLRNEEKYKIYDFETGEGFCPDFLLLLKQKQDDKMVHYQVFIEPKGEHIKEKDNWKQNFLKQITEKYGYNNAFKAEVGSTDFGDFYLIGLPFFTKEDDQNFKDKFKELYE